MQELEKSFDNFEQYIKYRYDLIEYSSHVRSCYMTEELGDKLLTELTFTCNHLDKCILNELQLINKKIDDGVI